MSRARPASAKIRSPPHAAPQIARSPGPAPACVNVSTIAPFAIDSLSAGNRGCFRPGASIMCPLKSKTLRGIVPDSSFDIAGTLQILPPPILTIFSCAGYCGHRLRQKRRHLILFSFVIPSLFELGHVLINPERSWTWRCPHYPRERASGLGFRTSALCQQRKRRASLDHLVGAGEQRRRHGEAERLRGLEVDREVVLCRCLHGQIGRLLAFEDAKI